MVRNWAAGWTLAAAPAGLAIVLLGAWAALVPLVGPYFDFGFHTDQTWVFSRTHWTLSLLPGIAAVVAGLLMPAASRLSAWLVGLMAALAGIWLLVGPSLYPLWSAGTIAPEGGSEARGAFLWIGYYYGVGALVTYLGACAQGVLSRPAPAPAAEPVEQVQTRERTLLIP